ncbi:MAG: alpha/beta fold hydrolase [Elusimicrobiota bacterium]|nr:alpha/beta fold hydrolase [Elusimicrobiota bacterium]
MKWILTALLALNTASFCRAGAPQNLKSFDGLRLDYEIDYPADKNASRVVVLLHGSGPQDMREDLSAVSAPGTKNYFFTDVSAALTAKGFAVVRYNKRGYQLQQLLKKDPSLARTSKFTKYIKKPLTATIRDAEAFAKFAAKTFPGARIYLLGHSEGSRIALHVADRNKFISGAGLIGLNTQSLDTTIFEQFVYRQLHYFDSLDADHNGGLTAEELAADDPIAKSLVGQMPVIDQDKSGTLERSEFMGASLMNILADMPGVMEWREEEAALKRPASVLRDAAFDVSLFQGNLDNQTQSYNAKALQLANTLSWKKPNLHFKFFPGLGHALDKRADYQDLVFKPADKQALGELAAELDSRWK